jgi:hypothetical protein
MIETQGANVIKMLYQFTATPTITNTMVNYEGILNLTSGTNVTKQYCRNLLLFHSNYHGNSVL